MNPKSLLKHWEVRSFFIQKENSEDQNYVPLYALHLCICAKHLYQGICGYVWVTLCTPEKDDFSLSLYLPSHQSSTLSLTYVINYPHFFLTAYKMTSRPSILAEMTDSKNLDLYYFFFWFSHFYKCKF